MPESKETEEERKRREARQIAATQKHNDRGDGCGKTLVVGWLLFAFGCILAEGARVMAENGVLY